MSDYAALGLCFSARNAKGWREWSGGCGAYDKAWENAYIQVSTISMSCFWLSFFSIFSSLNRSQLWRPVTKRYRFPVFGGTNWERSVQNISISTIENKLKLKSRRVRSWQDPRWCNIALLQFPFLQRSQRCRQDGDANGVINIRNCKSHMSRVIQCVDQ